MTKHYCDRCGKETEDPLYKAIPISKIESGFKTTKEVMLCQNCHSQAEKIYDKGKDVLILLFKDFLPQEKQK